MFFPYTAEESSKALGQIRRLRHRGNWSRIGSSDAYWTSPFLAVLVDMIDSLLLENPERAFELSRQSILLADRIRPEDSPGRSEVGKRSFRAWAHSVHCSSCRALEKYTEADSAIQQALWLTRKAVLPWASAEVWRRYAALLLYRGSVAGLDFVNKALEAYAGFPAAQADALVLRGLFQHCFKNDLSAAVRDLGQALELLGPKRSAREERTWGAAIHNLAVIFARGTSDFPTLELTLKRVRRMTDDLPRHEPYRRMLCLWLEALLLTPLGASRQAERLLNKARGWLFRHHHPRQGALCTVDLALILIREGDNAGASALIAGLPAAVKASEVPFVSYLEHRLATGLLTELKEESLAAFREALAVIASRPKSPLPQTQPLGMITGPNSAAGSALGVPAGVAPSS